MAQQVITLAKEETSQDILSRIERLETDIALIKPTVTQLGGGYPYVKTTGKISIYPAQKTIVVTGKAKVTIWNGELPRNIRELTLDGVSVHTDGIPIYYAQSVIELTCETGMQFKLKSANSNTGFPDAVVFAQFASQDGTLTYS